MIRTQIYLPEELYQDLKLLADSEGENFSSLIRQGAMDVITKKRTIRMSSKKWGEGFIGAGKLTGRTDAVEDIHDYYRHWTK